MLNVENVKGKINSVATRQPSKKKCIWNIKRNITKYGEVMDFIQLLFQFASILCCFFVGYTFLHVPDGKMQHHSFSKVIQYFFDFTTSIRRKFTSSYFILISLFRVLLRWLIRGEY